VNDLYVLDTSAIFTLTDEEDGAGEVEKLLDAARANKCHLEVCAISLMEIYYITLMEQGEDEAARLVGLVKSRKRNNATIWHFIRMGMGQ
jgi:uncharacterized protein with PIN domain